MGRMKEQDLDGQQAASLDGMNFIATTRISNLVDDTIADVGETCERVPPDDLADLLHQGAIVPVDQADAQAETEQFRARGQG